MSKLIPIVFGVTLGTPLGLVYALTGRRVADTVNQHSKARYGKNLIFDFGYSQNHKSPLQGHTAYMGIANTTILGLTAVTTASAMKLLRHIR